MSRFGWFNLIKDDKIVGNGCSINKDFLNNELFMDYVTIYLDVVDKETILNKFELVWKDYESGSVESRGIGTAHFSILPPTIRKNTILFKDVVFKKEIT